MKILETTSAASPSLQIPLPVNTPIYFTSEVSVEDDGCLLLPCEVRSFVL